MNRFERNHAKKQIEGLKLKNLSLTSGQVVWALLGIFTLPTIIIPYACYGYVRRYSALKRQNLEAIKALADRIGAKKIRQLPETTK